MFFFHLHVSVQITMTAGRYMVCDWGGNNLIHGFGSDVKNPRGGKWGSRFPLAGLLGPNAIEQSIKCYHTYITITIHHLTQFNPQEHSNNRPHPEPAYQP